jgi:hypothetical protein
MMLQIPLNFQNNVIFPRFLEVALKQLYRETLIKLHEINIRKTSQELDGILKKP